MSRVVAKSFTVVVDMGPTWIMPALLTTISTRPKRCVAWSTKERTCSWFVTSQGTVRTSTPRCIRSCRARTSFGASRAARTNRHPARTNSRASASPSPREPLASQDRVHEGANSVPEHRVLCLGLLSLRRDTCVFWRPRRAPLAVYLGWLAAHQAQLSARETPSALITGCVVR